VISRGIVGLAALCVVLYSGALVWISGLIRADEAQGASQSASGETVLLFVGITLAASIIYLAGCIAAHRRPPQLLYVLVVGALARMILLFGSPGPVLEGDHERLRFDARLMNHGVHPYAHRPSDLADQSGDDGELGDAERLKLALVRARVTSGGDGPLPEEVARPDLRSTSTPAAIAVGSLGDRFKPKNTRGHAFLILCADALACFFILMALRSLQMPLAWVIVYAWSPILLKEAYCTLAVDAFVLPAIAGLVYGLVAGRRGISAFAMALGFALRPAFVLLAPVMARRAGLVATVAGLLLATATIVPYARSDEAPEGAMVQGPLHVWRHFEFNSFAENLLRGSLSQVEWRAESTLSIAGVDIVEPGEPLFPLLAKVLCLGMLLAVATYLLIRVPNPIEAVQNPGVNDVFVTLVALLLCSPVLQPQHTIWLLPLLAVRMYGLAWLALPSLASLSYLAQFNGPMASDYLLPGTAISYRLVEFGLFALLLVGDRLWRARLFPRTVAWDEDLAWKLNAADEAREADEAYPLDVEPVADPLGV
jgi:hypothetical protein